MSDVIKHIDSLIQNYLDCIDEIIKEDNIKQKYLDNPYAFNHVKMFGLTGNMINETMNDFKNLKRGERYALYFKMEIDQRIPNLVHNINVLENYKNNLYQTI